MLELIDAYERGERHTPAQVFAALPEPLRQAIEAQDEAALQHAFQALSAAERTRAAALLAELQSEPTPSPTDATKPRPDIEEVIQRFLPMLGDIALAACGDDIARQLAEAMLPTLEENGWRLGDAAQRIWQGERDAAALVAGIDPNSATLVQRILRLVTDGPAMIFVAGSLQIARLRRQADAATTQALTSGDAAQRAELARQLAETAAQADQQLGAPWGALADHLRALATQLEQ